MCRIIKLYILENIKYLIEICSKHICHKHNLDSILCPILLSTPHWTYKNNYLDTNTSLQIQEKINQGPHELGGFRFTNETEERSSGFDQLSQLFRLALFLVELTKMQDTLLLDTDVVLVIVGNANTWIRDDLV